MSDLKVQLRFKTTEYADMDITVSARGFLAAVLYWANADGPLPGWSSFAAVPIEPSGSARYCFGGHRAVPPGATHVCAKYIAQDFSAIEESLTEIPHPHRTEQISGEPLAACSCMSDLHLSGKTGKISRALSMAASPVLIPGDLTNDGFEEQFSDFYQCVETQAPDKLILSVTGNHDQRTEAGAGESSYARFQRRLLGRAARLGYPVREDDTGAYSVRLGYLDIIGLQSFRPGRKTAFSDGAQLEWLKDHLDTEKQAGWHIILCHAPLLAHNPHRREGMPYFAQDAKLQQIADGHRNIIFVSGHTHFSPNTRQGNAEYSREGQTVYIDTGSVVPTELGGEPLMPSQWKDGVITELIFYDNFLEIRYRSVHTGLLYPRGYYRFRTRA